MNFDSRVYALARKVPRGKVTTYSEIDRALQTNAYRRVGQALSRNRDPKTPCHRVVKSDRSLGGYSCGAAEKQRLLRKEGVKIIRGKVLEKQVFRFS